MIELIKKHFDGYTYWCWRTTFDPDITDVRLGENINNLPVVTIPLDRFPGISGRDYAIAHYYIDVLEQNGLFPKFITHKDPLEQLKRIKPAAILIPGGTFQSSPENIDAPAAKKDLDLGQYHAYTTALNYARENKLPTLGICAGCQMMGVILGGKISARNLNDCDNPIHRNNKGGEYALTHPATIMPNSLLNKIIGADKTDAKSLHNYSLSENFTDNFNIVARAPDNVIEAIEPKNPWNEFVLGIQWHPERLAATDSNSDDAKIFRTFAAAITTKKPN